MVSRSLRGALLILLVTTAWAQAPRGEAARRLMELRAAESRMAAIESALEAATVGLRVGPNQGSGVIVSSDGLILTAAHVFEKPGTKVQVMFSDGKRGKAVTLGRETTSDCGLMRLTGDGPWPFAPMGSSKDLNPYQFAVALGHPGGVDLERGVVLRWGRLTSIRDRFLRSSCVIDQGDSGGPLFDLEGRVIGIHSRIMPSPTANYHVPIDRFRKVWDRLLKGESWRERRKPRPRFGPGPVLGIRGDDAPGGCVVLEVYEDLPADEAGLKKGDVISFIDGDVVRGIAGLKKLLATKESGVFVDFVVRRGERRVEIPVMLRVRGKTEDAWTLEKTEEAVRPLLDSMRGRVFEIEDAKGRRRAEATALGDLLVAKASAVPEEAVVLDDDGNRHTIRVVGRDPDRDLIFLSAEGLRVEGFPVPATTAWKRGQILLVAGSHGRLLARGIVSVPPRKLPGAGGFLGIYIADAPSGVRVDRVSPGSAAEKAGLARDDVIHAVDSSVVTTRDGLIKVINAHRPGAEIRLKVRRGGKPLVLKAILDRRPRTRRGPGRFIRRSRRLDGFSNVVQTDAVLEPEDCGAPVLDSRGALRGLLIARSSRTESYVLPISDVAAALRSLARSSEAVSDDSR
ncbi:MAG TPA: PDZ domain-containing protein [Planctomycetes bacterium]|nr:PDZ domain-containing protein [Planctomycetota bacterium]